MAGVTGILAAVWAAMNLFASHRVYLKGYHLIENGMTRADVERALRSPPGYYASGEVAQLWSRILMLGQETLTWTDDDGAVMVGIDVHGRVIDKAKVAVIPVDSRSWTPKGLWNRYIYWRKTRKMKITGGID
jgi:hypothetical protein